MKVIKILLILLLIVYPFGDLFRIQISQNIYVKLIDIFSGIIFIIYFAQLLRRKVIYPKKYLSALIFPCIGLISLIINVSWLHGNEILTSGLYLIRWVFYLSIFFALSSTDMDFKNVYKRFLIFIGMVIVLLGFGQYFFYSSLIPWITLGWDDHLYRLFSVFLDPNFAAAFFVLYFIYIAGIYLKITNETKRQYQIIHNYWLNRKAARLVLGSIGVLSLLACLLTFSRSGFLMLLVGTIIFLLLSNKKKLIGLFLILLLFFVLLISPYFKFENINLLRGASSYARLVNNENAISIFIDKPLFGVGFNTYRYAKTKYGIQTGWSKAPSHADAGVDNSFLFILATTGMIGFWSYLLFWKSLLSEAYSKYANHKNVLAIVAMASILGLFVHALFINSLFYPEIMLWMWIIFGLLL